MTATTRKLTPARLRSLFRQELTAARKTYRAMGWTEAIRGLRNVELKVSGQLTRATGNCQWRSGQPCLIKLSSKLLCHETATEAEALDTIRHEIAHAAAGHAAAHGPEWVRAAQAIGCSGEQFHTMHEAYRAVRVQRITVDVRCEACDRNLGTLQRAGWGRIHRWTDGRRSNCCRAHLYTVEGS